MTDQNTTHSPRVDEQLARDTAALTHGAPDDGRQERRRDQVPGDDEPQVAVDRGGPVEPELETRSRLASSLIPSAFPGTGDVLADCAEENSAPPDVIAMLRSLPEGRIYKTVAEIWTDLGGEVEQRPDTESDFH